MLDQSLNPSETTQPEAQEEPVAAPVDSNPQTFCLSIDGREIHLSFEHFAKMFWPLVVEGWYANKVKVEPALLSAVRPFAAKTLRKDGVLFDRHDDALDIMLREYFRQMVETMVTWKLTLITDGKGTITSANLTTPRTGESGSR